MTERRAGARKVGLLVNPVAGLGGRVGLKGTDGHGVAEHALRLGATPVAGSRATRALRAFADALRADVEVALLTAPLAMGEAAADAAGLASSVVGSTVAGITSGDDTQRIACELLDAGVELLVFVGGDGTARDVLEAVGTSVPVLGIPAGVKMYSGAFAVNPDRGGELAAAYLEGLAHIRAAEVMDIAPPDHEGRTSPMLYGYLRVPYRKDSVQGSKEPTPDSERDATAAIGREAARLMSGDHAYILGPGTTTLAIASALGLRKTLIGVDVITRDRELLLDASENDLLRITAERPASIIVTPIGGQGFIFGRGNPQISPRVLARIPAGQILIVATPFKLARLGGEPLRVDTGGGSLDRTFAGYVRVLTGDRSLAVYPIA